MVKIEVKEKYKWKGNVRKEGEVYDVSEEEASKAKGSGKAEGEPEVEKLEIEEDEGGEEEDIPEDWKKYHLNRGFSPDEEEKVWSKTIGIDDKEVTLVRDFSDNDKGNKYAIGEEVDNDRLAEITENHPDLNMFSKFREGELDLEEAIAGAERENKSFSKSASEIGDEISVEEETGGQSGKQKMKVKMEPAMELNGEDSARKVEENLIKSLKPEDFRSLIWDPEEESRLPYDKPTASAEAYDLFARIIEMATGVKYNVKDVEFRKNKETYECDVKIVRESGNPGLDGKVLKGFKTKSKSKSSGDDQWRERIYTKARRNALKSEIPPTWVSRLVKEFSEKKSKNIRK